MPTGSIPNLDLLTDFIACTPLPLFFSQVPIIIEDYLTAKFTNAMLSHPECTLILREVLEECTARGKRAEIPNRFIQKLNPEVES